MVVFALALNSFFFSLLDLLVMFDLSLLIGALDSIVTAPSGFALLDEAEFENFHNIDGLEAMGLNQVDRESLLARADCTCDSDDHNILF